MKQNNLYAYLLARAVLISSIGFHMPMYADTKSEALSNRIHAMLGQMIVEPDTADEYDENIRLLIRSYKLLQRISDQPSRQQMKNKVFDAFSDSMPERKNLLIIMRYSGQST